MQTKYGFKKDNDDDNINNVTMLDDVAKNITTSATGKMFTKARNSVSVDRHGIIKIYIYIIYIYLDIYLVIETQ